MAILSLSYAPPVCRTARRPPLDYAQLEAAVALADEGRPIESLTKALQHLLPGVPVPDLSAEPFSFSQGSSRVTARVEGEDFVATVPLVRLPEGGGAVAALRYVLTAISCSGELYQPRLRGDEVHLEYRDRLARLHPAKVVEVLRRMPVEADGRDDWLVGQFGARPLDHVEIAPLGADEFARAEAIWRSHWADVEELLKECQRKRSRFFLNELSAYALHRVAFALPLHGHVGARLQEGASTFNDSEGDVARREAALGKCVREMKAVTADELARNLGHAEYALSPLRPGTPAALAGNLGPGRYLETIDELRGAGKSLDAALALFGTYTFLLARFSWPEPVEAELVRGLERASGKPWREAATLLREHARALTASYVGEGDDGEGAGEGKGEDSGDAGARDEAVAAGEAT